ncbi:MAG: glucoamylase [Acidobacteriota bacterium]|nr:glucoamylase [Acidobacteriota bacterium]
MSLSCMAEIARNSDRRMLKVLLIAVIAFSSATSFAQMANNLAPGAPGKDARWESAGKEGIGTSTSLASKVWFTLRDGVMTEVYYPTVDVANVRLLQFIVVSPDRKRVEVESEDTTHFLDTLDPRSLSFRQVNQAKSGAYTISKTYIVDPQRNAIQIRVHFETRNNAPYSLYVYYDPSLNNSGMHDSAWTQGDALLAVDADKASALISSTGFEEMTNGYFETSDGLVELRRESQVANGYGSGFDEKQLFRGGRIARSYARAMDGNVVQVARVKQPAAFTLALGFGKEADAALKNARSSLTGSFASVRNEYDSGWHEYLDSLRKVETKYQRQFERAAMVLKAHEDKTYRGAMVASLTVPWGGGANANEPNVGGYHTVWARDLYEVATAFYAMGDTAAAARALNYLFTVQQKSDGSFPQNSWLDGRAAGGGLQMDEVAYPLILAYQLNRTDNETWAKHVKPAADFIVRKGPATPQERWEEEAGYSPSTIAAEIAGLVCAAEIARRNHDEASAKTYLATADEWARKVDRWTATTNGTYGDKNYYIRITENNNPDDGARLEINSNGGIYDEREIVDAGFLELVRLGIKRADDPLVIKSLGVVDKVIQVQTPNGAAWYRYNHDAYGERDDGGRYDAQAGRGRLWTLLTGERGEYELARGLKELARKRLDAMMSFANEGGMIPEQVWDKRNWPVSLLSPQGVLSPDVSVKFRFGQGTGSATPLAWATAQFIRLAINLQAGRNLDTPDIVAARYIKH